MSDPVSRPASHPASLAKRALLALLSGATLVLAGPIASAQSAWAPAASTPSPPASSSASDPLYQRLGAQPGLTRLVDDLVERLLDDPRMRPFFKDTDLVHLKQQLVTQLCEVAGGPCRRQGKDMAKVHAGVDIRTADFNALVELLQQSLDAQGIGFRDQNRLLARLAPMHRDIVNAP